MEWRENYFLGKIRNSRPKCLENTYFPFPILGNEPRALDTCRVTWFPGFTSSFCLGTLELEGLPFALMGSDIVQLCIYNFPFCSGASLTLLVILETFELQIVHFMVMFVHFIFISHFSFILQTLKHCGVNVL